MNPRLKNLADAGVSIWLDDLSRQRLTSGNLARMVTESSVSGVTTNPTIFAAALAQGDSYDEQARELKASGADLDATIKALTTTDVRDACDLFADIYANSGGYDGRVSIEVEPGLARDTAATVAQAEELAGMVGRDNVLIKIPATVEGLPAITATIAKGISVNVTLIFALDRYDAVIDAYLTGLEQAAENGVDLSTIHSVASFFVSRVDSEVDKRLEAIGTDEARGLKGKAGVANARLAYELYANRFAEPRFEALKAKSANQQRPLWASTGVKDPAYPDTMYVADLIAAPCVNTMPEKTMQAFADHGEVAGDTISGNLDDARATMAALASAGVDMADVVQVLEDEGVDKFVVSWDELVVTVRGALDRL
ncbi:transaldolase [Granulicoccus sp. GXG6511]|uniref:transaldolase n=1 Tax=Granulicoccus sp. GXG6511 TaxID=3381351 RepID=UPI003D7D75DB